MRRRPEPWADPEPDRDRPPGPRPSGLHPLGWALILVPLVLVQVTIVTFLPLTWAVPDLVLVTVLALAHRRGALVGSLLGAWAGVLLDLVPPAIDPLGGWTLVLCLAGFVHGHVVATRRPGPLLALALLSVTAMAATVAHALVLWFGGVPVSADAIARAAVGAGAWALLLAPVVLVITGGRIGADDPAERLDRQPMLLDTATPGWFGPRPAARPEAVPQADPGGAHHGGGIAEHVGGQP